MILIIILYYIIIHDKFTNIFSGIIENRQGYEVSDLYEIYFYICEVM